MATRPTAVRIDAEIYPQLEARAKRAGISVSDFMRQAVYEKLAETEEDALRQEVENLRTELEVQRGQFVEAVRAIMIIAGSKEPFPKEKVEEWVSDNLGGRPRATQVAGGMV